MSFFNTRQVRIFFFFLVEIKVFIHFGGAVSQKTLWGVKIFNF